MSALDDLFDRYPEHLTVADLVEVLGMSQAAVYRSLQDGSLPAYKLGKSWMILRDEIREHVRESRVSPPDDEPSTTGG